MSLAHAKEGISYKEIRQGTANCDEVVLMDKNENHVCEARKARYALRKRKYTKLVLESENGYKENAAQRLDNVTESSTDTEHHEKGNQENSKPSSQNSWRSRCGRKRKYFGQDSIRQGATKRERNRFGIIQGAFDELRRAIPKEQQPKYGKLSKFATLKLATAYISLLADALQVREAIDEANDLATLEMLGYKRYDEASQSEAFSSTRSKLRDDEIYTGDFTDILHAAEESEAFECYDEIEMQSPMEYNTNINSLFIR